MIIVYLTIIYTLNNNNMSKILLTNNLVKENFLIINNINMINKKYIDNFKKNPDDFLKNINKTQLIKFIQHLNYKYYIEGESIISDDLYDLLKDKLKEMDSTNPLLTQVGVSNVKKSKLPFYVGSMDKIKNDESALNNWINKYNGEGYVLSDKLDGISGLFHYKPNEDPKLYTRGDGNYGQDISYLIKFINYIPDLKDHDSEIAVRGELIITKSNFIKIKNEIIKDAKNVRNIVAGFFNSKKPNLEISKYIDFVTYECILPTNLIPKKQFKKLKKLNFKTSYAEYIDNIDTNILSSKLVYRRKNGEYDIDGIIVSDNKFYKRSTDSNPKYSFAFKSIITSEKAEVLVTSVQWNLTKDNYLQPIVNFSPVFIDGVKIQKATGFNAKFIIDNTIGPGSKLIIIRSGDVIPYIQKVLKESDNGEPSYPDKFKWKWNENKIEFILDADNIDSDTIKMQNYIELENFVLKLQIKGVSSGIIKKLFDNNINTISKLISIKKEDLVNIEGIGEKKADQIINSISDKMNNLDCIELINASNKLGRGFGTKIIKLILDNYPDSINKRTIPSVDNLISIKGIEKITAEKFISNLPKIYNFLDDNNLECKYKIEKVKKNNKLENIKIVLTGFRSDDLQKFIENNGGNIQNTVNSSTNILIIKDNDTTGKKLDKAKELNKKILTKNEFEKKYF